VPAAGAKRDILGYQLDYKGKATYREHAQDHQAQVLCIVFPAGLFRQPESLDHLRNLALDECQFRVEVTPALYKTSVALP